MFFQIHALAADLFTKHWAMSDVALADRGMRRVVADASPGFPCRVSLSDAAVGETLILLNYQHVPDGSPYAARHAIYVREGAVTAAPSAGEVPEVLSRRMLSVRAFDAAMMMVDADVIAGTDLGQTLTEMFANPAVTEIHIHNAKPGCFAAKATRAI